MTETITKTSKVYLPYLYTQIKYKSIIVYMGGAYVVVSKGTCHFKYAFKEKMKQTETNEEEWDKGRKSFKLYHANNMGFLFPCLFIFIR